MTQTFSKDVWRCIGEHLSKSDLIAVQLAHPRLATMLDNIPEIWHGKHLEYYQLSHQELYQSKLRTERDQDTRRQIDQLQKDLNPIIRKNSKPSTQTPKCEMYRLFTQHQLTVSGNVKFVYHQDTIHPEGECSVCDFSVHRGRKLDYTSCPACFANE